MDGPRLIDLEGATNFRDLGGYETADGGRVRFGEVYRSGRLPGLTDRDVETLSGLGIRTVVTLLTHDDIIEYGADRLPDGAEAVELPIDSPTASMLADRARLALSSGDFSQIPPELNAEIHRLLVTEGAGRYGELLRLISDPAARPLVFHCSHGVHRTGTAASILLSLLGVPWETVRSDYLVSNIARADEVAVRLEHLRAGVAKRMAVAESDVDMTNLEAFMIQDGSYIDASRDEILAHHGSFESYARDALDVGDDVVASLRRQLVN